MNIYLVVGAGMNDRLISVLKGKGFNIVGNQYTMDAAVITLKNKPMHPDLFIINGLAQASGTTDGVINRLQSMIIKLRDIRLLAPKSRILLVLPSRNTQEAINKIVSLGIYDIRQTSHFDGDTLLNWIENPMSIADFTGFSTMEVHDAEQGEIRYGFEEQDNKPFLKKKESIGIGRDLISKITSSLGGEEFTGFRRTAGLRRGKPGALVAIGDSRIEEWIGENFSDQMDLLSSQVEPEEVRQKLNQLSPDIFIIMRQSAMGGIPGADELAVWAAGHVPAVLFIVGQLDEEGRAMVHRASDAGIRHIITCEVGGQIYGDELVYVLTAIIKEMQDTKNFLPPVHTSSHSLEAEAGKAVSTLLQGAGMLGRAIKESAGKVSEKNRERAEKNKGRHRINKSGGVTLEEATNSTLIKELRNPTTIVPGGILAVVTPWRPGLAGRISAQAVRILSQVEGVEVAYIGATGQSTGAQWLDLPEDVLIMSDWRVPGSSYPIVQDNLRIFAVDAVKNLAPVIDNELWDLLRKVRPIVTYTVMDFAGDIFLAQKAVHQGRSVLLVIVPGNDPVELKTASHWVKNLLEGKQNVVTGIDMRGVAGSIPEVLKPKVIIRNNPVDAMTAALIRNNADEFIWN